MVFIYQRRSRVKTLEFAWRSYRHGFVYLLKQWNPHDIRIATDSFTFYNIGIRMVLCVKTLEAG